MVTRFCEADMNAPLPLNLSNIVKAREFINRAQGDLKGIVNLEQIGNWALLRALSIYELCRFVPYTWRKTKH